jgi:hypothetical protein
MQTINTTFGEARIETTKYQLGGLAVFLIDNHNGEPIATLSTCIPDHVHKLEEGEFFVKNWSENETLAQEAFESGLFIDTGKSAATGYVVAPVWKFKD